MKTYIAFIIKIFLKNLLFVTSIFFCLVIILNILSEIEFFNQINTNSFFPIYLSLLNTPSVIFEMFPFIFLITTQLFFINLFNNNEIQIFKYSGLKNSSIIQIIGLLSFLIGLFIIIFYYSFSSNLKNFYLEIKSKHTKDGKYLAVITKNGLWIKDIVDEKINIINASGMDKNFLINTFITQFDKDFNFIQNISSERVDIKSNNWLLYKPKFFNNEEKKRVAFAKQKSNFDYERIQNLFSNLSSLSLPNLFILKENYKSLNLSTIEIEVEINKIISYPFFFTLMTIFSSIIMFNIKKFKSNSIKISVGLFISVIVYYTFNFFNIMGSTEKLSILISVWLPIFLLTVINCFLVFRINEK